MDADAGLDLNMGADDGEVDAPTDIGLEFDLNMDTDVAVAPDGARGRGPDRGAHTHCAARSRS